MASLLVDTNFFLDCLRCGIPLDEVERFGEVLIPRNVIAELERLPLKGREGGMRKIVLEWIKKYEIFPLSGAVDETLVELAGRQKITVATNDARLRKSLADLGAEVIFIRSRSHLVRETRDCL